MSLGLEEEPIEHKVPLKPDDPQKQTDMIWEAVFNGDGILKKLVQNNRLVMSRLHWQDMKLNFILIFLALLLACWGIQIFT